MSDFSERYDALMMSAYLRGIEKLVCLAVIAPKKVLSCTVDTGDTSMV